MNWIGPGESETDAWCISIDSKQYLRVARTTGDNPDKFCTADACDWKYQAKHSMRGVIRYALCQY